MRDSLVLLPSSQMKSFDSDGPEGKLLQELRKRATGEGYEVYDVISEEAEGFCRNEKVLQTIAMSRNSTEDMNVVAVSSSGDLFLSWLAENLNQVRDRKINVVLIGTFPSREYQFDHEGLNIQFMYGSEDYVSFIEDFDPTKKQTLDVDKILEPSQYAASQVGLVETPNRSQLSLEIVKGADHFLFSESLAAVDAVLLGLKQQKNANGIRNFDQNAYKFESSSVHANPKLAPILRRLVAKTEGIRICDVACGAGNWGLNLMQSEDSLVGVDGSAQMLQVANSKAKKMGAQRVNWIQATSSSMPFESNSFDLVTTRLALHHFADWKASVLEMSRLVRPEGFLAISDLESPVDFSIIELQHEVETLHDSSHIKTHEIEEIHSELTRLGFEVIFGVRGFLESTPGIPLDQWCNMVGTLESAKQKIHEILNETSDANLAALGFSKVQSEFRYHAKTFTIMAKKKKVKDADH